MQYLGGKARLAKVLVPYIHAELAKPGVTAYYEPFMGGGNVFCKVQTPLPKYGSDLHPELMALWTYVQAGGELPTVVTEADYAATRRGEGEAWWRGFVGFGCSFGGKWMGGYARGGHGADGATTARVLDKQRKGLGRNYALNALNALNAQRQGVMDVTLSCAHFQVATMWADHAVIYCDPPYAQTTGYQRGGFDHVFFWDWAQAIAEHNIVLVSEYTAPEGVPCIAEFPKRMGLRSKAAGQEVRTERLFRLGPDCGWPQ